MLRTLIFVKTIIRAEKLLLFVAVCTLTGISGAIANISPANAQPTLPPLPPGVQSPTGLPDFPNSVNNQEQTFEAPVAPNFPQNNYNNYNNYNRNYGRYIVFVNRDDQEALQAVRQVEPSAVFNNIQGRRVIRAGTFRRYEGAQERVQQLARYSLRGRILSEGGGEIDAPDYGNGGNGNWNDDNNYGNERHNRKAYYVSIPVADDNLSGTAEKVRDSIRRIVSREIRVSARYKPKGSHVAVGPFYRRSDAESMNKDLLNLGFGNARVHYGK
ncbi:hypothetical protein [Calothrix sp. 336/3]|uniref:hypothetical protein n=1 Tax=Calothrix sp. 336/3 TaxID=1337936 RepID=UPI00069B71B4|nr:hypothetical protein [Calothrix sp. 336/3]